MKKIVSLIILVALITSFFVGCGTKENNENNNNTETVSNKIESNNEYKQEQKDEINGEAKKLEKIRVAYHPNLAGCSSIITGIEAGFFKEEGLEVELVKFTSGPPEIAAMVSGDIDIGYVGMGAHFLAMEGQVDIVAVDLFANSDRVLSRKGSGINSIEDLVGKKVAVPLGTSGETVLDLALEKANVDKNSIEIVNMDVAGAVSAFVSDQVDATAVWAPYTSEIEKAVGEENINVLAKNSDFIPDYVFPSSWMATPKYIEENRDTVLKFIRAIMKASEYRITNEEEVIPWISELIEVDAETLVNDIDNYIFMTKDDLLGAIESGELVKWFEGLQSIFMKTEKISEIVPVEDFVDMKLIKEALE